MAEQFLNVTQINPFFRCPSNIPIHCHSENLHPTALIKSPLSASFQFPGNKRRCPGCLKIIASRDAIDVHYLSCKVEVRTNSALHGLEIDALEAYASAGNKLFFEGRFSFDCIDIVGQDLYQFVHPFFAQLTPSLVLWQARFFY